MVSAFDREARISVCYNKVTIYYFGDSVSVTNLDVPLPVCSQRYNKVGTASFPASGPTATWLI